MIPFAAVLLAGGQSRRMGRDKALLPLPDGRPLWQRQLEVLRQLDPAELFISGVSRPGFPPEVPCLTDKMSGQGPLGGIQAALATMRSPRLVVLAIDLPEMTSSFLQGLLTLAGEDATAGAASRQPVGGFYEPLAAVYPAACRELVEKHLAAGEGSMQRLIQAAGPMFRSRMVLPEEATLVANWNQPEDAAHLLP